jgi:HK97 family phage prohead protease
MTDAERRFTSVPVEPRAGAEKPTIGGYAAKFDKLSQNLGGFVEQIDARAFNKSHGDGWPDVLARYNHEDNYLLGTTGARTLTLGIDEIGLTYDVVLPSSRGDVHELVQRGDVRQSSFAFIAFDDDWETTRDTGYPMRTLLSVRLIDVAPVNTPAYLDTSVGVRSGRTIDVRSLARVEQRVGGALVGPGSAYESLARKFGADVAEVRKLAEADELIKFFKRSDTVDPKATQRRSAQAALAAVLALDPTTHL